MPTLTMSDQSLSSNSRASGKHTNRYLDNQGYSQILWQNRDMVERWTRERRLEHTRSLLLDAAEEVFAEKGFMAASLDDIAHAAGYTKGAIYKHFATKEDLFLAVSDRYWRRYFDNFAEVMAARQPNRGARTRRDRRALAKTKPRIAVPSTPHWDTNSPFIFSQPGRAGTGRREAFRSGRGTGKIRR